jgi:histidyl-tRNA synthetase
MTQIAPVRGMNDILPAESAAWQHVEGTVRGILESYAYEEMRVPVVEHTDLFKRAIGEFTDVVEKEMYSFVDQGGEALTLRPEATAGIVRATISNGMLRGARHKLWCMGPMFRHERPQKGRFRQFHQVDVEAIGFAGPDIDAELIAMTARFWRALGVQRVTLQINSLGTAESRRAYRALLIDYFSAHRERLDADSLRRLEGNPLRILDSKMQELVAGAPMLTDHLDAESAAHFAAVRAMLDACGIAYVVNPRLVRGLDYYSRTVFEWITDALGSQDAICSGGRYDGLIAQLGGEPTPAVGFAMGIERVVALVLQGRTEPPSGRRTDVFVVAAGEAALRAAIAATERLRDAMPSRRVELNLGGGQFKAQFRRADRSGAPVAVVLGEDEAARGVAQIKAMQDDSSSRADASSEVPLEQLPEAVEQALQAWDARRRS